MFNNFLYKKEIKMKGFKERFTKEGDLYLVFMLMILMLFVGCSALLDTSKAASNAAIVDKAISSGDAQKSLELVSLSEFEKMTIVHALNKYNDFTAKYKPSKDMLNSDSAGFDDLKTDYTILKNEYLAVENIVKNHWDEYTDTTKIVLKNYQDRATNLDASIQKLIDTGERHKSVLDAIEFARILGGIAAKAL